MLFICFIVLAPLGTAPLQWKGGIKIKINKKQKSPEDPSSRATTARGGMAGNICGAHFYYHI